MQLIKEAFLAALGISSGLMVSAGVFTVLLSVGMTPRFAGKTGTQNYIFHYENCIIGGAITGTVFSVIQGTLQVGAWIRGKLEGCRMPFLAQKILENLDSLLVVINGLFMGIFVGCLAMAIAEMLDSIPIFARRISFRHGLGMVVLAVALGKLAGGLLHLR